MKLKSFNNIFCLLIAFSFFLPLKGEDKIDIWKKKEKQNSNTATQVQIDNKDKIDLNKAFKKNESQTIQIEETITRDQNEKKVYGVYDPADFNFNLNMWSTTKADDVRATLKRIKKIKLSQTSEKILENILMSFAYPPEGMSEEEFVKLKIDWMINNNRLDLLEDFLKQNKEFKGKSRAVQYIVDVNIAQANIKKGCEKIEFIDSTIKDAYLEKFKIYCLVFENKKSQAQLLLDLLREQNQSDNFFDDKINFLLGISDKTSSKVDEKNLLNFYLSSVTIDNFTYTPSKKTKREIWKYLNAANLIKLDDITDQDKITDLEIAANQKQVDENIIFNIYKQIPFSLNSLINAKNTYQTLDALEARALIYQKYLLADSTEAKVEYLFLLEDLFKKANLENIYEKEFINNLKQIGLDEIPKDYKEVVSKKISILEVRKLGKVKYNDKILHQSKIIKYFVEDEQPEKIQKEVDKIFKRLSKNRKYFYSGKDLALIDALIKDGFKIPDNFNQKELALKYEIPKNLIQLIEKKQNAFLALKIVEIIGEDEPDQLDPETIYFITNLLNKMNLIKIRNKVLISALPQRV